MDNYKLEFTQLQIEIFKLLCIKAGGKFNQREIAKLLEVTPTGVSKALKLLDQEELIKVEKSRTMNLNLVSLNRSQKVMRLKKLENLRQIYGSGLIEFLEENFPGTTIIIFGSYDRGEDTLTSDVDIAIMGGKQRNIKLEPFESKLERQININFYQSFKDVRKELKENLFNGTVLSGGIAL